MHFGTAGEPVDYDVVVVGLGAAGSAAAATLARRGLRVLGVEQFTPAHDRGSSHGATRIIRKAYFERPDYVPLLQRTYELWDELCVESGLPLFERCGALMVGTSESRIVRGSLASAERFGLDHEVLDAAGLRERFPQFAVPDDAIAVFEPDAGYLLAEPSIVVQHDRARAADADLWFETTVTAVDVIDDVAVVRIGDDTFRARAVVLATGAWAPRLAGLDSLPFETTRQTVHWYEPTAPIADFGADNFPVYCYDCGGGAEIYGFPAAPWETSVKVGLYHDLAPTPIDPDDVDREISQHDVDTVHALVAKALPTLAGRHVKGTVCLFAAVPDDDFVLGTHPQLGDRVVLAIGFSGHGFKFAPVVGEIVADLVIDGRTDHDIAFLSPTRLRTSS